MVSELERPQVEDALTAMVDDALASVRKSLALHPAKGIVPPYGLTLTKSEEGIAIAPFTFLDITKRHEILRKLIAETNADAFLLLWQGFVDVPGALHDPPMRLSAVLIVTATRWGTVTGRALPFHATPLAVDFHKEIHVPQTVVTEYGTLFGPLVVM